MNRKRLDGHFGWTCLLQCYLSSPVNGFRVVSEQCDPYPRHRLPYVSPKQLDHFLDFITSAHIVQDLPFGEKTLNARGLMF